MKDKIIKLAPLVFRCRADNDLFRVVTANRGTQVRYSEALEAVRCAPEGAGVLILADGYPKERTVVASDAFGPTLPKMRILMVNDCHYLPVEAADPHLVLTIVEGYDTAVYGLSGEIHSLLFNHPKLSILVATTKLSQFVTGRYSPTEAWPAVWKMILGWLQPEEKSLPDLKWTPTVRPMYPPNESLPADAESQAVRRGIEYYDRSRLYIHPDWPPNTGLARGRRYARYFRMLHFQANFHRWQSGRYLPFELPVGDVVQYGRENLIVVRADNFRQVAQFPLFEGWFGQGGFLREARLVATHPVYLDHIGITAEPVGTVGLFRLKATISNPDGMKASVAIAVNIRDRAGKDVAAVVSEKRVELTEENIKAKFPSSTQWIRDQMEKLHKDFPHRPILIGEFGLPINMGEEAQAAAVEAEFAALTSPYAAGAGLWHYAEHRWPEPENPMSPYGYMSRDRKTRYKAMSVIEKIFKAKTAVMK